MQFDLLKYFGQAETLMNHIKIIFLDGGKTESYPCDVAIGDIGVLRGLSKHTFVKNIS